MKRTKPVHSVNEQQQTDTSTPVLGGRKGWSRKPMTQIVSNKKAEQRRAWCRKGTDDGAVLLCS